MVNAKKSQPLLTHRSLEDEMNFTRYLKQGMDMENMQWDDFVQDSNASKSNSVVGPT